MDLRNWEFTTLGSAVVGADVYVYDASTSHPNAGSILSSTVTDSNGMWSFTGLSDSPKDIRIVYQSKTKWYKGLVRVGADQIEVNNLSTVSGSPDNPILNPLFNIWQGGTSFTMANLTYYADGWLSNYSGTAVFSVLRTADVPAVGTNAPLGSYCLHADCTTADGSGATLATFHTRIEGSDFAPFAQRVFTLTFWVKSTKTGIFCVAFRNSGSDRYYNAEYTVSASNTWEYKTITVPASPSAGTWDYTTGNGLSVIWTICGAGAGVTGSWQTGSSLATANQVNGADSTANDFKLFAPNIVLGSAGAALAPQPIALQYQRALRYYWKSFPYATVPAQNAGTTGAITATGAANFATFVPFPVQMRATPSITTYNPSAANSSWRDVTAGADRAATVSTSSEYGMSLSHTGGAGVAGNINQIHAVASARL